MNDSAKDVQPLFIGLNGFGLSWKDGGSLNYSSPALTPWDGIYLLDPPRAELMSNVWLRLQVDFMVIPECPWCQLEFMTAAFMGVGPKAKKYSAGVAVEQINLNFGIFKLLTIGSAFGVWRLDETDHKQDNGVLFINAIFMKNVF
jgi:hypothetical protein